MMLHAFRYFALRYVTQQRLLELQAKKAKAESRLVRSKPISPPSMKMVNEYRDKVLDLSKYLYDPEIKSAALSALRPLISKVIMTPTDGGWHGVLYGKICALSGFEDCNEIEIILPFENL